MKKKWTLEEVDCVKRLAGLGNSYTEISKYLDRTPKSVQEKMKKLGFVFRDFHASPPKLKCINCNNEILNNGKKFCSQSCSATYNNLNRTSKKLINSCQNCGIDIHKNGKKFCSKECDYSFKAKERRSIILKDDNTLPARAYKKFLIDEYGEKCMGCGWGDINPITKKCPIELEHIDGNHKNNHLKNLKLLCPNCHSLTPTYKALNKGNGRHNRMERYNSGKSY